MPEAEEKHPAPRRFKFSWPGTKKAKVVDEGVAADVFRRQDAELTNVKQEANEIERKRASISLIKAAPLANTLTGNGANEQRGGASSSGPGRKNGKHDGKASGPAPGGGVGGGGADKKYRVDHTSNSNDPDEVVNLSEAGSNSVKSGDSPPPGGGHNGGETEKRKKRPPKGGTAGEGEDGDGEAGEDSGDEEVPRGAHGPDKGMFLRRAESRLELDDIAAGKRKTLKHDVHKQLWRAKLEEDAEKGNGKASSGDDEDSIEDITEIYRGNALDFSTPKSAEVEDGKTKSGLDINAVMLRSRVASNTPKLSGEGATNISQGTLAGVMEEKGKPLLVPLEDADPEAVKARWSFRKFVRHSFGKMRRSFSGLENLEEISNDELLSQLTLMGEDMEREEVGPQFSDIADVSHWTYRKTFNRFMLGVIGVSLGAVGAEADYIVKHPSNTSISNRYPYYGVQALCTVVFVFEAIARARVLGYCYLAEHQWMAIALLVNFYDCYYSLSNYEGILKLGFVLRFVRFFQAREMFYYFPRLARLLKKMFFVRKAGKIASTVGWCALLTVLFANIMSIFFTDTMKKDHEVLYASTKSTGYPYRRYWGVSVNSFFSLLQIIVWDKGGTMRSVIRPIVERLPFMLYPFFGVYALGTLGIVQVLAGSIVAMAVAGLDTAKKVAYEEDLKRRQQEIMTLAEPLNDHVIHDKEMGNARADVLRKYLLSNEHAVSVFARCKLDRDEISELLTMLERHDSPDISVPEFLGACSRLHGDVHSKDVYTVILALERATKQEDRLGLMFSDTFRHLLFVSIVSQRIGKVIRLRREAEGFQRFGSVQPKLVAAEPKFRMPPFFVKTYHPRANSIPVKGLFE